MSGMSFELIIQLVDKASDAMKKIQTAEKALEATTKATNDAAAKGAAQAEAALKKEAAAAQQVTAAQKAAGEAAKTAGDAAAQGAGKAASEVQKSISMFERLKASASSAGASISNAFGKAMSGIRTTTGAVLKAGRGAGSEFAKGIGAGIKAELPNIMGGIGNILKGMWGSGTGFQFMGGPGALRMNMQSLTSAGIQRGQILARSASSTAYSNVQGAINMDEQLRPDLGEAGARAYRSSADRYLLKSPFRRDDVRAALPEAARSGLKPGDPAWNALMDAAASQNTTPQQAVAAWAAMKKGDASQMAAFGINAKTGEDGKVNGLSYMANGQQQNVDVSGNLDAKITAALQARFSGSGDRKSMSMDGVITRSINAWDAFVGKVMDSGPYDFVNKKLQEMLGWIEKMAGGEGIDAFAKKIGTNIVEALTVATDAVKTITQFIAAVKPVLDPVVEAFGGWKNVIIAIVGLKFLGWITGLLAPLGFLTSALTYATTATWAFLTGSSASSALAILTGALSTAATAAWAFAAALLANPITWIVAGVLALAAAAYLVYQNWDKVGPMLTQVWEGIKTAVKTAWTAVTTAISDAWNEVTSIFDNLKLGEKITAALDSVSKAITDWGSRVFSAMERAFEPVVKWFDDKLTAIGRAWDKLKGAVGMGGAPVDPQVAKQEDDIARAGKAQAALALLEQLKSSLSDVQAAVSTFDLASPIRVALDAARSAIANVSFHAEGVAMMTTLAAGIKAGSAAAVSAVRDVTQQMRDHLPHSPAKVGPLSDLDRVRFSETLAGAIRPEPAVDAVRAVAAGMAGAISAPRVGVLAAREGEGDAALRSSGGGAGNNTYTISYAPNVQIPPGREGDGKAVLEQLRQHAHELAEIVNGQNNQNGRLSYQG